MVARDDASEDQLEPSGSDDVVLQEAPLGFPWLTVDPFIVTVHHVDPFPAGRTDLGPVTPEGQRREGAAPGDGGWAMYYGDVVPGFPQHPHRGFETVTVVRSGVVDHSDSLGATARYGAGDVQWLTAGRGIQHAEMFPLLRQDGPNPLELFQIWLNLPAADKMVEPSFTMFWQEDVPRPVLVDDAGRRTEVTVAAGRFGEVEPPAPPPASWAARPEAELAIWHLAAEPEARFELPPTLGAQTVRTLYLFDGSMVIGTRSLKAPVAAVLRSDRPVTLEAGPEGARALVLQGRPIGEPVASGGPFVMNTQREIEEAYRDYRQTGFGGWPWDEADPVHPRTQSRFALHPDGRRDVPTSR
jgi:redox-sensitive bicupin YhaK (pirin superfamily)